MNRLDFLKIVIEINKILNNKLNNYFRVIVPKESKEYFKKEIEEMIYKEIKDCIKIKVKEIFNKEIEISFKKYIQLINGSPYGYTEILYKLELKPGILSKVLEKLKD